MFCATWKIGFANALGTNSCKKNVATLNSAHQTKQLSKFESRWKDNRAVSIASKSSESKRFARRLNKVERKYIQEQQPN